MTYELLFLPIFLQDKNSRGLPDSPRSLFDIPGGVGLSTRTVDVVMSSDGIVALVVQSIILPTVAHYLGIWRLFGIVTVLHPIVYVMVPFLVFLPPQLLYVVIHDNVVHIRGNDEDDALIERL
ncbi:hypothetical protein N7457_003984 [Penicillium paradoxum]|uniref:uncharacterized protein n=1 Tax=Penicillium paradoxum TaxID=176176 RepID=UPI002548B5CA|nr:uncharacterized protein N7457_003984 [Penicillium paradoxum]KAJ5782210.1 hypothetical protein N7457_003984 [Penicillium paradoxum]